jgi:hypothetical protein
MPKATECGVNLGATFLEYKQGKNVNFAADRDISEVFGCLATAVGQEGCGYEQQLQALNWAFNLKENETQLASFIRPEAFLGIIILTDEDDCSTEPTSLLAAEDKLTTQESWSLRCATRGHECSGANLTYPTNASFENDFTACKARQDACDPKETGEKATSCSPLASIKKIAENIKSVKWNDTEWFLVAGIIGWPTEAQTSATYKIAMTPNPTAGQPDLYDYWPVCYDPDHPMPATGPADRAAFDLAFGWGGFGGLRVKAFLNEFDPDNKLVFSICERDYSKALTTIGENLANKLVNLCINFKLLDTNLVAPGLQADCLVVENTPILENGQIKYKVSDMISHCDVAKGQKPCWRLAEDPVKCPGSLKFVIEHEDNVVPPTDTRVKMNCLKCESNATKAKDAYPVAGCDY